MERRAEELEGEEECGRAGSRFKQERAESGEIRKCGQERKGDEEKYHLATTIAVRWLSVRIWAFCVTLLPWGLAGTWPIVL